MMACEHLSSPKESKRERRRKSRASVHHLRRNGNEKRNKKNKTRRKEKEKKKEKRKEDEKKEKKKIGDEVCTTAHWTEKGKGKEPMKCTRLNEEGNFEEGTPKGKGRP